MAALLLKSFHMEQRAIVETMDSLGLEVLPHPPYSPDLAPSDYHHFDPMKKMLAGQKFVAGMEMQWAIRQWLASGIHKLVERWDKCLNKFGGYVET